MHVKLQLVMCSDDGQEEIITGFALRSFHSLHKSW
jgi:hypothetical protein